MTEEVQEPRPKKDRFEFHYIKSNLFRVIHADGAHGGVTPGLKVQMALFSERIPIPQKTTHKAVYNESEGSVAVGEEITDERVARKGLVREVETEVLMDVETAKKLYVWLGDKIKLIETLRAGEKEASGDDDK